MGINVIGKTRSLRLAEESLSESRAPVTDAALIVQTTAALGQNPICRQPAGSMTITILYDGWRRNHPRVSPSLPITSRASNGFDMYQKYLIAMALLFLMNHESTSRPRNLFCPSCRNGIQQQLFIFISVAIVDLISATNGS
jgi:hypothetical protein